MNKQSLLEMFRQQCAEKKLQMEVRLDSGTSVGPYVYAISSAAQFPENNPPVLSKMLSLVVQEPSGWKAVFLATCDTMKWAIPQSK